MNALTIIQKATADGVNLNLSKSGRLKATGDEKAVNRWLPTIRKQRAGIVAALREAANDTSIRSFWWLIHFIDRDPLEASFCPVVDHGGALAAYPDAVAAEPIHEHQQRASTEAEEAELRRLVGAIYPGDTEADRTEALAAALDDPDDALTCYRAIAAERGLTVAPEARTEKSSDRRQAED
ncbi:MAG: hypothetical protein H6R10_835 [Rhodocyclaceae bacterium]|nr:hypothetical protein [Rhodocyclaceae bacterium]